MAPRQFSWKICRGKEVVDLGHVVAESEREALSKVLGGRNWTGRGWKVSVGGTMAFFDEEDVGLMVGQARGSQLDDSVGIKELVASDVLARRLAAEARLKAVREELDKVITAGPAPTKRGQKRCHKCVGSPGIFDGRICTVCGGRPDVCPICAGVGTVENGAKCRQCWGIGRLTPLFGGWPAAVQEEFEFSDADRRREGAKIVDQMASDIRGMLRHGVPPAEVHHLLPKTAHVKVVRDVAARTWTWQIECWGAKNSTRWNDEQIELLGRGRWKNLLDAEDSSRGGRKTR